MVIGLRPQGPTKGEERPAKKLKTQRKSSMKGAIGKGFQDIRQMFERQSCAQEPGRNAGVAEEAGSEEGVWRKIRSGPKNE